MCVLSALRGDEILEMGDRKHILDSRGGSGQRPGC